MRRFDREYMLAKKNIEEGKIGKPVSFKSISRDPMCPGLDYAKVSGGLIMDMAIHDFVPYIMERFGEAYTNELKYFVDCIYNDQNPSVTGQDGRAALEIALAATQSYKEAKPVEIPLAGE